MLVGDEKYDEIIDMANKRYPNQDSHHIEQRRKIYIEHILYKLFSPYDILYHDARVTFTEEYLKEISGELDKIPYNLKGSAINTVIKVPSSTKIISFSDVHGDIDALIIALRDCAKVITKDMKYYKNIDVIKYTDTDSETNIRKNNNDDFLEYLLRLDLNNPAEETEFEEGEE